MIGQGSPTVLVVDNVEAIVEELLTLLAINRIPAVGAHDLNTALDVLQREPTIRAISCDVRLDDESGLDLVARVESCQALRGRPLRYLFVTGDQMQVDHLNRSSNLAVLSKPVQPQVLVNAVRHMLSPEEA